MKNVDKSCQQNVVPVLLNPYSVRIAAISPPDKLEDDQTCARTRNLLDSIHKKPSVKPASPTPGAPNMDQTLLISLLVSAVIVLQHC